MKKVITISLMVVALIMGGVSVDAKTTKKSTKTSQRSASASASFTAKSFMQNTATGYALKSVKQIKSILASNGYKYIGSEYTQVSEFDADCFIFRDSKGNEVLVVAITDSNAGVVEDVNEITLNFVNSTERDKFMKGVQNEIYGAGDQVQVQVNGNQVTLVDDCYYC